MFRIYRVIFFGSKAILSTDLLERYSGLFEIVANFLEIGKYAREKGQFARKVRI